MVKARRVGHATFETPDLEKAIAYYGEFMGLILAEREKQIAGRLKEAEAMASETQEKLKRYNDALREARSDGYKLLEKERAQAMKEKEEKLRQYREQMSKEVAAQVETTRRQEQTVKGELEAQAATIGSLISSQILRRPTR